MADVDVFDSLLTLEETAFEEGRLLGMEDGKMVGIIEGRALGLSNGFSRMIELGHFHGRALLWEGRLLKAKEAALKKEPLTIEFERLLKTERHITNLLAITDPQNLDFRNEEASLDFCDQTLRKAQAKARLIERALGELHINLAREKIIDESYTIENKVENIEDVNLRGARR